MLLSCQCPMWVGSAIPGKPSASSSSICRQLSIFGQLQTVRAKRRSHCIPPKLPLFRCVGKGWFGSCFIVSLIFHVRYSISILSNCGSIILSKYMRRQFFICRPTCKQLPAFRPRYKCGPATTSRNSSAVRLPAAM